MSTIIGKTLIYALEEAVNRQEQINLTLLKSNLEEQTKIMLSDQSKMLLELLSLCERVY